MATKKSTSGRRIESKAKDAVGKIKAQRIDKSGLTSRVKGHISARGKSHQGKRDSK